MAGKDACVALLGCALTTVCLICCLVAVFLFVYFRGGRFVSTRLRHLRLSPDGTTLVVKSEKGGVDHELALDELLEVLFPALCY